ncbi:putative poly(ADP-ribose) glycohydrolase 1-like isoform X1 [Capsicum annuum]|uniref:probable GPI-anchored adhesin-like protein PGA55 n=1 Tax=Capsicum annuum TaxID=4072 RepID=UPI001FB11212|nr:probable GPI-anchored adhesin-like protein PGA55 [Capsicum annuum]KAF3665016.1 putative poly(ADP-ribose) glycohydrolase 1-like isoform X1 [Capsicum annuum]
MEKKKQKDKKWSYEKRSPLQDLNVIPRCNSKSSNASTSSSIFIEAPKGRLPFFISSNSSSSSSSSSSCSSSSSRVHFHQKPKLSSRILNPMPKSTRLRSKSTNENVLPRPKKNPPFLSGKKPTSRNSNLNNPMKKSAFALIKPKILKQKEEGNGSGEQIQILGNIYSNLTNFENCTPLGKLSSGSGTECATLDQFCNGESSNTNSNTTKTPPIEASVSPEIQFGLSTGLVSAATPCYAAGHVLSGITDKRKCRPRGVLTIGTLIDSSDCEKASGLDAVPNKSSRVSLIPLPALASMHWLSSPCRENNAICEGESVNEFGMLTGSAMSELPDSASTCSGSTLDSVHNRGKYCDSVNRDVARTGGKARIVLHSPGSTEYKDPSSDEMGRNSFPPYPLAISCCRDVKAPDEWKCSCSLVWENSPCSTASLSSGNVIQTPKSDLSSGRYGDLSWLHSGDHGDNLGGELDSVADFLYKTSLSPTTQPSALGPPNLHFKYASASWVSDSTLDNVSQSHMRISWRDGLVSRIFESDDLDCCRCLTDDENAGFCFTNEKTNVGVKSSSHEENDLLPESGSQSSESLEHKHELSWSGKLKSPLPEANLCAESICIEGGGLVSSADSDWTHNYKNQLYQI